MEKIKLFFEEIINLEKEIEEAFRKEMFEEHNNFVDKLNAYAISDMVMHNKIKLPLSPIKKRALENNREKTVFPRDLFKISEYTNSKYGKVWLCYVSGSNPRGGEKVKLLSSCYIVAFIDNSHKIVGMFNPDYDTNLWSFRGGDPELEDFYAIGEFVATERYMSPVNDEWSIEEYNKEA